MGILWSRGENKKCEKPPPSFSLHVDWKLPWLYQVNIVSGYCRWDLRTGIALLLINMKMPPFALFRTVYQAPKLKKNNKHKSKIQQHCCHLTALSSSHKLARKFQHWNWVNTPQVLLVYADVFVNETSRLHETFNWDQCYMATTAGFFAMTVCAFQKQQFVSYCDRFLWFVNCGIYLSNQLLNLAI